MTSRHFHSKYRKIIRQELCWDWERQDIIRSLNVHDCPVEMSLSEEELLKCPMCKRFYNDPICLPCGHSLCAVCLQALLTDQNAAGTAPGETISCLVCGLSVSNSALEISQCPRNIALRKLCEYLTNSATDSVHSESMEDATFEVIFCDEHDDRQAIERFCLICRKLICATCAERNTTHAGHAIVSLSEGDNPADVCRRVVQYCEDAIAATRERLKVNQAHLDDVRNCNDLTGKAFRLLESNVASVLQGVFRRRDKQFQEAYKDAEIGCTEEGRILKTRLASTETFRTKLTSLSSQGRVPRLSEMHRALRHLGTTPAGVGTVSDHAPDSFSSKLTEDLNEVLDQCVELLLRMKCQFPGAEVVSKVELEASAKNSSIFEKGDEVKLNFETSIGRIDTSSPISHDHPFFSEFLNHEFPARKENEIDERNSEDFVYKNSPGDKVNLLTDGKTGEEYYVELDEALDVKSLSENSRSHSTKSVNNSTSRETSDDSLPEVNFL